MVDKIDPWKPLAPAERQQIDYESNQARLRREAEERQKATEELKNKILAERGPELARKAEVSGENDPERIKKIVEAAAKIYAKNETRPGKLVYREEHNVISRAIDIVDKAEELSRLKAAQDAENLKRQPESEKQAQPTLIPSNGQPQEQAKPPALEPPVQAEQPSRQQRLDNANAMVNDDAEKAAAWVARAETDERLQHQAGRYNALNINDFPRPPQDRNSLWADQPPEPPQTPTPLSGQQSEPVLIEKPLEITPEQIKVFEGLRRQFTHTNDDRQHGIKLDHEPAHANNQLLHLDGSPWEPGEIITGEMDMTGRPHWREMFPGITDAQQEATARIDAQESQQHDAIEQGQEPFANLRMQGQTTELSRQGQKEERYDELQTPLENFDQPMTADEILGRDSDPVAESRYQRQTQRERDREPDSATPANASPSPRGAAAEKYIQVTEAQKSVFLRLRSEYTRTGNEQEHSLDNGIEGGRTGLEFGLGGHSR